MTQPRTLVLLSGGLDSAILLGLAVNHRGAEDVGAVSVDYGQRHVRELDAAKALTDEYSVDHTVIDLSGLGDSLKSALLGDDPIPHGHYAAANMAATVVPNRNAIMLMAAAGVAATRGFDVVTTAVHAGDHPIYPDCRPEFIAAASEASRLGTTGMGSVTITAPFVQMSKADIVSVGARLDVPFELSWSCYEGGKLHCGRCGTCVERAEAFDLAGVHDPTAYADPTFWRQAVKA